MATGRAWRASATCSAPRERSRSLARRTAPSPPCARSTTTSGSARVGCCASRRPRRRTGSSTAPLAVSTRARRRGGGGSAARGRSWRAAALRRRSGAASSSATARPSTPRDSCGRCAGRRLPQASACTSGRRSRASTTGCSSTARGIVRATGDRRRHERLGGGLEAALPAAHAVRQLRRPHRAGARAARRDRLDRRRGDHRLPHVPPLLPDDRRRPRAHGLRLGPDRLPRQDRRALLGRPADGRAGGGRPSPAAAGARRGEGRALVGWADRRLRRPPAGVRHGAGHAHPLRRRLHGQRGRAQLARRARSSPRSRSAWTTSGRACRSSIDGSGACLRSRSTSSAGASCARR